eukprot:g10151.t1
MSEALGRVLTTDATRLRSGRGGQNSGAVQQEPESSIAAPGGTSAADSSATSNAHFWVKPLLFSLVAGASTSIGALLVISLKGKLTQQVMAFSLALASGVMTAVSILSLQEVFLEGGYSEKTSHSAHEVATSCIAIAMGAGFYFLLSKFALPDVEDFVAADDSASSCTDGVASRGISKTGAVALDFGDVSERKRFITSGNGAAFSPGDEDVTTIGNSHSPEDQSIASAADVRVVLTSPKHGKDREDSGVSLDDMIADGRVMNTASGGTATSHAAVGITSNLMLNTSAREELSKTNASMDAGARQHSNLAGNNYAAHQKRSWRITMLLFLSLLLHNFPEGLAVAVSTLENTQLGITITLGILIHNIPEGIAIAVPCYAARPNEPRLAFWLATISGLAEPIGAAIGLLILNSANGGDVGKDGGAKVLPVKTCLAFVSGVMLMVVVYDLLPESMRLDTNSKHYYVKAGMLVGILIMVGTEMLLRQVM